MKWQAGWDCAGIWWVGCPRPFSAKERCAGRSGSSRRRRGGWGRPSWRAPPRQERRCRDEEEPVHEINKKFKTSQITLRDKEPGWKLRQFWYRRVLNQPTWDEVEIEKFQTFNRQWLFPADLFVRCIDNHCVLLRNCFYVGVPHLICRRPYN